ncbi:uncharacterized protein LOC129729199 [Wyeomyia smithii]|uniref:uncharacterized protein LOC129729199 n=1 Tax=Wyeomyia smithii TaxID=174621 RepID=UPI002467D2B0|nr:uncharacterized protein LOC129729199 [Wyeomyia smithii]
MGIPQLETFLRKKVPNGNNSRNEQNTGPVIVLDTTSFLLTFCKSDIFGQVCGGRFNRAFAVLNTFFTELTKLGAELVFFVKSRLLHQNMKKSYKTFLHMADAVDEGLALQKGNFSKIPYNYDYVIKQLRKIHGTVTMIVEANYSVQELVAYANSVGAFAIMSNTTSFLLYEGNWRLWSSKDIDMKNFTCKEYNRKQLMLTLGLSYQQMPLFCTISGYSKLMPKVQIQKFNSHLVAAENSFSMVWLIVWRKLRGNTTQTVTAQFPEHITPPPLLDLYSSNPELCADLYTTKLQLYCWVVSDRLEHRVLQAIPERLRVTASTICFLMENQILKLFEAGLLLQVAFDVVHETYDYKKVEYPGHLDSRAFHVIFVYQEFYNYLSQAVKLVGLAGEDFRNHPPLDGVLFHNRYAEWKEQGGDLQHIKPWRIYAGVSE